MKEVLISIKPEYTKLIEDKLKKFEFRNYLIKSVNKMIVYESNTSVIKYIMEIDKPINKINFKENNIDEEKYNYAYPIIHLYKLEKPITLTEMKSKFNVSAPQKYVFMDKYPLLKKELENIKLIKIF